MSTLKVKRMEGQRVIVGTGPNAVTVEVTEISSGGVRLAFTGPPEIEIDREEIRRSKEAGQQDDRDGDHRR